MKKNLTSMVNTEKFLNDLKIYWVSKTSADFDCVDLINYGLEFYANGWIYGYELYCRDGIFPMHIVKENKAVKVYNVKELLNIKTMIENHDDSFFNVSCERVTLENTDKNKIREMVRKDKNILSASESAIFDNTWYILKTK